MMTRWQWILGSLAATAVLLPLAGLVYAHLADARERLDPPRGRLIDVGGRRLHLYCSEPASAPAGGPTVVIEQGAGEPSRLWWPIQARVAEFARVCTYDRAGYGASDPAAGARSIDDRAIDLHTLLTAASVPGPYVLVAHSYGGLIVRRFAARYPELAAGLVLVDTPEEVYFFRPAILDFYAKAGRMMKIAGIAARFGVLRLVSKHWSLDAVGLPFVRACDYAATVDDITSLQHVDSAMVRPGGFGSLQGMPLAVITHGQAFPGPFAILDEGWRDGQTRLASLSTAGELIVAEKSNHMIQHDEPELVLALIRRIYEAAATRAHRVDAA
jgi:pimeloyl-ACP methyl ester carboxylesterase